MRSLRLSKAWLTLGWFMVGLLVYLSLSPAPPELPGFPLSDKAIHLLSYAWIMLWFGFIYTPGRKYLLLGLTLILLGVLLEILQGASGYRSMEFSDASVNGLGVFAGWLLARTRLSSSLLWAERLIYRDL